MMKSSSGVSPLAEAVRYWEPLAGGGARRDEQGREAEGGIEDPKNRRAGALLQQRSLADQGALGRHPEQDAGA